MASLEAAAAERLKSRRAVTNAVVRVCRDGNETTILTIEVPNP